MHDLVIAAGPSAYARIRDRGLSADDVSAVFGASGAAKWLAIAGLDHAVFSQFMPQRSNPQPVDLFGTSVGAFKLSAAARKDPGAALKTMAAAYVEQSYAGKFDKHTIDRQTQIVLSKTMGEDKTDAIHEILNNRHYRLHVGTVRCHGGLNSLKRSRQALSLARAALLSTATQRHLAGLANRAIFSDPRRAPEFQARDGYAISRHALTPENLIPALRASGAIPIYMAPVSIPGEDGHIFHDGGMLDYHPVPGTFWPQADGLILYPHFYDRFKMRWFDKFYPWRKAPPKLVDNVVMIAPSRAWVAALPDGKIPSRQDFPKYRSNEAERFDKWHEVVRRSRQLGEMFLDAVDSGKIKQAVVPL